MRKILSYLLPQRVREARLWRYKAHIEQYRVSQKYLFRLRRKKHLTPSYGYTGLMKVYFTWLD